MSQAEDQYQLHRLRRPRQLRKWARQAEATAEEGLQTQIGGFIESPERI